MGFLFILLLCVLVFFVVRRCKGRGAECEEPVNEDDGPIDGYDS